MAGIIFSEGSGVNDSVFGKSQAPIRMFLEKRGEAFEAASMLPHLFTMEKSTNYAEKYTSMTAMNGFSAVGENGAYPLDNMQEGYSTVLENVTWKDSFSVSQEMIEDAKLMNMRQQPAAFIAGYHRTRERFGAALFGAAIVGNATFNFTGKKFGAKAADGSNVFATSHAAKVKGAAQSNLFSDAFSADALAAAESAMQDFRGDNGEILDVAPDTIVIPNLYALKKAVFAAIGADKDPNTANNAFNYTFGRWNVIVWPYLNEFITSGTAPWVLLDSKYNAEHGGAIFQDRTALTVRSTIDENTDANVWRGRARFVAGVNDWRFACCAGVSGGTDLIS